VDSKNLFDPHGDILFGMVTTKTTRASTILKIAKLYTYYYSIENVETMIKSNRYNDKTTRFLKKVLKYKIDKLEWSIINPPESPPKKPKYEFSKNIKRQTSITLDPDNCPPGYHVVVEVEKCGGKGQTQIVRRVEKIEF
tara:strand:- start:1678 stop:2094 length:417 start_codon:yes stop_codon:yes gene_type:complete